MEEDYYKNKWIIHFKFTNGIQHPNNVTGNPNETVSVFPSLTTLDSVYKYVCSILYSPNIIPLSPEQTIWITLKEVDNEMVVSSPGYIHTRILVPCKKIKISDFLNDHIMDIELSSVIPNYMNYVFYVSMRQESQLC